MDERRAGTKLDKTLRYSNWERWRWKNYTVKGAAEMDNNPTLFGWKEQERTGKKSVVVTRILAHL